MGDEIAELRNDLYEVLGLEPGSDAKDIARAYKKKSLKHHPDRGGDVQKFLELKHARDVLLDPKKKEAYDKKLSREAMKNKRQREEHAQRSQQRQRDIDKLRRAEKDAEERRKRQKRGHEYSREELNRYRDSTRARQQEFEESAATQDGSHSDARSSRESTPCTVTFKWDRRQYSHSDDTIIRGLREYGEIVSVKMKTSSAKVVFASKASAVKAVRVEGHKPCWKAVSLQGHLVDLSEEDLHGNDDHLHQGSFLSEGPVALDDHLAYERLVLEKLRAYQQRNANESSIPIATQ
ncbi:hypothetical protein PINS_up002384 [Pythium insidiosum]|nr:hypothetical protein PINS_up002384 [Pythium insidiosum]